MTTPSLRDGLGKSVGQGEVSGGLGRGRVLRGEEPAGEEGGEKTDRRDRLQDRRVMVGRQ